MNLEIRPFGVRCNIGCVYCYQNPERDAGNVLRSYDLATLLEAIKREGHPFTLFGGEPLLMPVKDLEKLWAYGLQKFGSNGIQTNGTLIRDDHVQLFHTYKVHVGISVDGPGELNDARWSGSLEKTRNATAKTHAAIEQLCKEQIPPSLIVTLHRINATRDKLPAMHAWMRHLEQIGVKSARLHLLEVETDAVRSECALSSEENVEAMLGFLKLEKQLTSLKFDMFEDMRNMLLGRDNKTTCVWNACDPYTTKAVQGIEGNGQRSNCGRTNKEGIDFVKSDSEGFERYMALYQTPQEYGGCKDCRFFLMCKGQCPGTAIDGDWRNRTELCEVLKTLYRHLEEEMITDGLEPLSVRPVRKQIEEKFLNGCAEGKVRTMANITAQMNKDRSRTTSPHAATLHGDHTDGAGHSRWN